MLFADVFLVTATYVVCFVYITYFLSQNYVHKKFLEYPEYETCSDEAYILKFNCGVSEHSGTVLIYDKGNECGNYESVFLF
jgi:hypothetical protein